MLSKACKLNTEWSISFAYQLVGMHEISNEVWFVCIREWRNNRGRQMNKYKKLFLYYRNSLEIQLFIG